MADLESRYHQACEDSCGSPALATRGWSKVRSGLVGCCCRLRLPTAFAVVSIWVWSRGALTDTGAVDASRLAGVFSPPALRRGSAGYSRKHAYDVLSALGPPSPWKQLAIRAIEANNRRNSLQQVSVKATGGEGEKDGSNVTFVLYGDGTVRPLKTQEELDGVDEKTKAEVLKLGEKTRIRAQDLAGITAPTGFFDPFQLSAPAPPGQLLFFREVEIKHGRVAMLASLGILVGEQFHPLFGGNIDVPAYIAFQQTPLQTFWPAVVAAIAIPEIFSVFTFEPPTNGKFWEIREDHEPGNLGWDPLGLKPTDPNELKIMQTKELNNGRLAMIAAAGMIAQELVTNQKIFET